MDFIEDRRNWREIGEDGIEVGPCGGSPAAAQELQVPFEVNTQILPAKQRALAVGALALGAFALGALALGMLVIGRLAVGRARIRRLQVDELVLGRLRMEPQLGPGSQKDPGQTESNRGQTPSTS